MKHSIWMRLALIILSVSMVLSFAACKPAGNDETTGKETEQKTEVDTTVETEATTDDAEVTTEDKTPETTEAKPVETTDKKPVETTEKKPVETTEKKPVETTEKKPVETTEKKPEETTEKPEESDPYEGFACIVLPEQLATAKVAGVGERKVSEDGSYVNLPGTGATDGYILAISGNTAPGKYVVMKYRLNNSTFTGRAGFCSNVNAGPKDGSNQVKKSLPVNPDGEWHIVVYNMSAFAKDDQLLPNAEGKVVMNYWRIDFADGMAADSSMDVAYVGIVEDVATVFEFAKANGDKIVEVSEDGGAVVAHYTSTGTTDPAITDVATKYFDAEDLVGKASGGNKISKAELSADKSYVSVYGHGDGKGVDGYFSVFGGNTDVTGEYVIMKYRYPTTNAEGYNPTTRAMYTGNVKDGPAGGDMTESFPVIADGEWHMTVFNIAAHVKTDFLVANEDGTYSIKYFRFDLADGMAENCCIDIEYIAFTDAEGLNSMIAVAKGEGLETVTARLDATSGNQTYYTATGTTTPPSEDETGTGDEVETDKPTVEYKAPYYKFSTENIQGSEKVHGGTNSMVYYPGDINVYGNGKVTVTGWMMAWDGVEKYQYSFDGGNTWIDVPADQCENITREDLIGHIGENESAVLSTDFEKNGIYRLSIPVDQYHQESVAITICAIIAGGHRVEFLQLLNVNVAHAPDVSTTVDNGDGTHTLYCGFEGCDAVALVEKHTEGDVKYFEDEKAYYSYCSKCADVPLGKVGPLKVYYEGGEFGESVVSKGKSEVSCIYFEGDKALKEYTDEDGTVYTRVTISKNGDIYFYPWKTSSFSKVTGQYMVFKYRYQKDGTSATEFNFYTSTERTTANGSAESLGSYNPKLYDDGEWHIAVVDLSVVSEFNMKDGAYHVGHVRFGFSAGNVDSYIDVAYWGLDDDLAHVANLIDRTELGTEAGKTQHDHYLVPVTGDDIPAHTSECVICGIRQTVDHTLSDVQFDADASKYIRECSGCDYTIVSPLNVYLEGQALADVIIANGGSQFIYTEGDKAPKGGTDADGTSYVRITISKEKDDTYFYPWKGASVTTGQYLVFKYRYQKDGNANNNFNFYTCTTHTTSDGKDGLGSSNNPALYDDGEWHIVVVDLTCVDEYASSNGVYKAAHLRFGFGGASLDSYIDLAYLGFVDDLDNLTNVIDKTKLGTDIGKTRHDHYLVNLTGEGIPAHTSQCMICGEIQTVDHTWGLTGYDEAAGGYRYDCDACDATSVIKTGATPNVYIGPETLAEKIPSGNIIIDGGEPVVRISGYYSNNPYCVTLFTNTDNVVTGQYMVMKYRLPDKTKIANPFIWCDTAFPDPGESAEHNSNRGNLNLTADGEWHVTIINLAEFHSGSSTSFAAENDGTYKAQYFRLDPLGRDASLDEVWDVQYIAFCDTFEKALAFDADEDYAIYISNTKGHKVDIQTATGKLAITGRYFVSDMQSHTITPVVLDNGFSYTTIKATSSGGDQYKDIIKCGTALDWNVGCKYIGILYQAPLEVTVGGQTTTNKVGSTQFYFNAKTTSYDDTLFSVSSKNYIVDGNWHLLVYDISSVGTGDNKFTYDQALKLIRWDYLNGGHIEGAELNIANIGFYTSLAEAKAQYAYFVDTYNLACGHDAVTWAYVENDADATNALYEVATCNVCKTEVADSLRAAQYRAHSDYIYINGTQVARTVGSSTKDGMGAYTMGEDEKITSSVSIGSWAGATCTLVGAAYYRIFDKDGNQIVDWTWIKDISANNNGLVDDALRSYADYYDYVKTNQVSIGGLKVDFTLLEVADFTATEDLVIEFALVPQSHIEKSKGDKYITIFKIKNVDLAIVS